MSTTINVTVGGGGLLGQSRQQMQANRFGKLERDQDAKTTAEAQQQRQDQRTALIGRMPQTKRVLPEPAANRHGDDLIRIEARESSGALSFFTSKLPYTAYDFDGEPIDLILAAGVGPFDDAVIRGSGGPDWSVVVDASSLKPLQGDFTVEAWSYWPTGQSETIAPFRFIGNNSQQIYWSYRNNRQRLEVIVGLGTAGFQMDRYWEVPFADGQGQWIHIAVVRASSMIRLYVNGSLVGDDKIKYTSENFDASAIVQPTYIQLDSAFVFGDTAFDYYWQFNQFVLAPKKARYSGSSFTPPTKRL